MTWAAAAAIGGSLLGAGAGIYSANKGADAEKNAAQAADIANRDATKAALALSRPQIDVGYNALSKLSRLYGLGTPKPIDWNSVDSSLGYKAGQLRDTGTQYARGMNLFVDPAGNGYVIARQGANAGQAVPIGRQYPEHALPVEQQQAVEGGTGPTSADQDEFDNILNSAPIQFVRGEGEKAINRMAAAKGRFLSGSRLKGITDYNSNLASTNFQNLVVDPMFRLAGYGGEAASNSGNTIVNTGANTGNAAMAAGAARSSGYAANNLNYQNAIGTIGGALSNYFANRRPSAKVWGKPEEYYGYR